MENVRLSFEKGLKLLKNGHSLTACGKNLDTLKMKEDGTFSWCGRNDRAETILEEKHIKSLFRGRRWSIDLIW